MSFSDRLDRVAQKAIERHERKNKYFECHCCGRVLVVVAFMDEGGNVACGDCINTLKGEDGVMIVTKTGESY